jgi:hypothetical protein
MLCGILGIQPPPELAVLFQANNNCNNNSLTMNCTRILPATTIAAELTPPDGEDDDDEHSLDDQSKLSAGHDAMKENQ